MFILFWIPRLFDGPLSAEKKRGEFKIVGTKNVTYQISNLFFALDISMGHFWCFSTTVSMYYYSYLIMQKMSFPSSSVRFFETWLTVLTCTQVVGKLTLRVNYFWDFIIHFRVYLESLTLRLIYEKKIFSQVFYAFGHPKNHNSFLQTKYIIMSFKELNFGIFHQFLSY